MIELDPLVVANTLVDYPRYDFLDQFLTKTRDLPGDIAEVGVYRGGTALFFCQRTTKRVLLFDTFEGMPPVLDIDLHKAGDFNDTSIQHVDNLLSEYANYAIYKGIFPAANAEYIAHKTFSLVHLDVDIYQSVIECLRFFCSRMTKGGIIVLDDYNEPNCPGAKLAADEFAKQHLLEVLPTVQSQAYIQF